MAEDSTAVTSPPPPPALENSPTSNEVRPEESVSLPPVASHQEQPSELVLKEESPVHHGTAETAPDQKELTQSADESEAVLPQQATLEAEPPQQVTSEPEPPRPVTSEPEPPQEVSLEPEPPQQSTFSEPEPPQLVTSEPEPPQHVASSETKPLEQVTSSEAEPPEQVTSETEPPRKLTSSEPEPPQRVTPEPKLSQHVEASQWTEPEPPDAAVLEAAAAEPEPEQLELPEPEMPIPSTTELEAHNKRTPAENERDEPAAVESRSLAEMMDKEETEAAEENTKNSPAVTLTAGEEDKSKIFPRNLGSFKEESNKISDLSESERKSLQELRQLLQESPSATAVADEESGEISVWGIPLLKDDRSDVVLLKFLRARDFKVQEAHSMLRKTIQWRKDFNIEELVDENLGDDLDKVVFMHGHDREGHPVCYNVYGEFQNRELYQKTFSDEEKRNNFLRWRIQFLEKSIRKLDFSPGGVSTIFQVNDLKNSPGPGKTDLRLATKQAVQLLQDNYPEFVAKQIFVNVPWWYLAFYRMISPFMTQRSKSKLVFAGPSRSAETLFKYISPEQVPIQYGGLSVDHCDCNSEFTTNDPATEITIKPTTKQNVEIIIYEKCIIVWEVRVVGWEVSYGAEFMPDKKEAYTVIIQKPRKMTQTDEPVVSQSFKVGELGKILLTIDNPTTKKKKLVYRFKVKPLSD